MLDYSLVTGDPSVDFFQQNPELEFYPFVAKIKIDHKKKASDILWALYMAEDPKSKIYHGLDYEERIDVVEKKYSVDYVDDCVPYKDAYINAAMGPHERIFKRLNDKFQKMVIANEASDLEEATDFFAKIAGMYKGLDLIESKYAAELEQSKQKLKGNKKPGGLYNQPKHDQ